MKAKKLLEFFPIQAAEKPARISKPTVAMRRSSLMNPCEGCPLNFRPRIKPILPPNPLFIMVGACPSEADTTAKKLGSGPSGDILHDALAQADLELGKDVGLINLTRCQALEKAEIRLSSKGQLIQDIFESEEWITASHRCSNFLKADLMPYANIPLVPLGTPPLQYFMQNIKIYISKNRGLRRRGKDGQTLYPTWNPTAVMHRSNLVEQERLLQELFTDIRNTAAIVRGTGKPKPVTIHLYTEAYDIIALLEWLLPHPGPWAFDIETFDDKEMPSRDDVATDPCHPDFRVRGVGIAWSGEEGAFLELKGFRPGNNHLTKALGRVFGNDAPKWAANGHFDEEGLVYTGWTPSVTNRAGDSMLAMIAASTGQLAGFSLERGIVDVLHEFYHWSDVDKRYIRDLPVDVVADGCVRDAAATWRLCDKIHGMMERGEYLP